MKLIILDRDGVINEETGAYVRSPDEWIPIPGSLEAIARLSHAGYHIAIATNQAGIARGFYDIDTLNEIHKKLHQQVARAGGEINAILFCPDSDDKNPDRKPNPGMLLEISKRLQQKLSGVVFVGDSLRDVEAARTAGAVPVLVKTGNGKHTIKQHSALLNDVQAFDDLAAVADCLLKD